jgi:hypothetical protein
MSLQVDEERRRGRSKSPGRRADDRDRNRNPAAPNIVTAREPSYAYPEDDLDDRYAPSSRRGDDRDKGPRVVNAREPGGSSGGGGMPYPEDDGEGIMPGTRSLYDYDGRQKQSRRSSPPPDDSYYRSSREKVEDYRREKVDVEPQIRFAEPGGSKRDDERRGSKRDDEPRVRYAKPRDDRDDDDDRYGRKDRDDDKDKLAFLPQKYSRNTDDKKYSRDSDRDPAKGRDKDLDRGKGRDDDDLTYGRRVSPPKSPRDQSPPTSYSYSKTSKYEYSKQDDDAKYPGSSKYTVRDASPSRKPSQRERDSEPQYVSSGSRDKKYHRDSYQDDPRASAASVLTADPGSRDRRGKRDASPLPPTARMSSLSVNTGHHSLNMSLSASNAPASPLLESYRGTYQDMSPMPSPLLLASNGPPDGPGGLEALSPLGSDDERGDGKKRRRARFHDPEDVASRLAKALKGDKPPDTETLIEVLPGLTHEQVMELRGEYKRLVKTGADRKGVNVAKHIRARMKDEDPNLMKACYAVALGKWESEAYWANFWYQGDKTRRELLIESIMGRTNEEIHYIKEGFSDKKYDNSLMKCMKTELKEDKFKKAVLLVLDERRMDEYDEHGRRIPIDGRLVEEDVAELRKAVKADKGGESLMISIVVQRSDAHLREVLKLYERTYRANFAREALKKSGNLVVSTLLTLFSILSSFRTCVSDPEISNSFFSTGRAPSAHSQRRHQQAGPGRAATASRTDGVQAR